MVGTRVPARPRWLGFAIASNSEKKVLTDSVKTPEVKSGGFRTHASFDRFIRRYRSHLGEKYVICSGDYLEEDGITYLPIYMTHCLG